MGKLYLGDQEIGVYQMEKAEEPVMKFDIDANGKISKAAAPFVLPSNAKVLGDGYAFYYLCRGGAATSADLSSLTTISGRYAAYGMFQECTSLTSADLSSLTEVSGSNGAYGMFHSCSNLTSVDLSSLTEVSGSYGVYSMFGYCSSLTSVDLSALTTISGSSGAYSMFQRCTGLTTVDFSSLRSIGSSALGNAFYGCSNLKELRFPALTADSFGSYTSQFQYMLSGVTGCILHFPAAIQAKIETMSGYPNFSGTNTIVLFDL